MPDYRVRSAIPTIMGGLQSALGAQTEYKQRQARDEKLAEGAQLLQTGTPEEVGQWTMQNPELAQQFVQSANIQDQLASRPRVQTAKDILAGRISAREAYQQRLEEVEAKGGDISNLRGVLTKSDDELLRMAEMDLAIMAPQAFNAYLKAKPQAKGDAFTLSEGQGRYDPQGNLIAYMPKTVDTLDKELKTEKDRFDKAAKLRGEVEKVSKVYRDVEDAYGRIQATTEGEPTGASDMALIFNYMKMLDPGSTVREGEFATAAQTGGVPAYVRNLYNKALDGQMLTEKQRSDFMSQAKAQYDKSSEKHSKRLDDYEKLGSRYGLDRADVIVSDVINPPQFQGSNDQQAYDWATSNPDDPRAARILQKLGVQ
ncbi:MAG: hypothetical protein ACN2B6_00935 [Rickettsiales bacterium]